MQGVVNVLGYILFIPIFFLTPHCVVDELGVFAFLNATLDLFSPRILEFRSWHVVQDVRPQPGKSKHNAFKGKSIPEVTTQKMLAHKTKMCFCLKMILNKRKQF